MDTDSSSSHHGGSHKKHRRRSRLTYPGNQDIGGDTMRRSNASYNDIPQLEHPRRSRSRRRDEPQSPRRRQRLDESYSYIEDSNEARDSFDIG